MDMTRWDLKKAICRSGMKQKEIAARICRGEAWLSHVVHGRRDFKPHERKVLARLLDCSVDALTM